MDEPSGHRPGCVGPRAGVRRHVRGTLNRARKYLGRHNDPLEKNSL